MTAGRRASIAADAEFISAIWVLRPGVKQSVPRKTRHSSGTSSSVASSSASNVSLISSKGLDARSAREQYGLAGYAQLRYQLVIWE